MATVKTVRAKMADEGLYSYIVEFAGNFVQYWAYDAGHAGEQFDNAFPWKRPDCIYTQEEYEKTYGATLAYDREEYS